MVSQAADPLRLSIVRVLNVLSLPLALLALPAFGQGTPHQPPVLMAFALNNGAENAKAGRLVLAHAIAGANPTEYRVSARSDFDGAVWMSYEPRPTADARHWRAGGRCEAAGFSRLVLFLQVRRRAGEEVRIVAGKRTLVPVWLESNVLADSICIESAP